MTLTKVQKTLSDGSLVELAPLSETEVEDRCGRDEPGSGASVITTHG